jgi:hypothetical protein
MGRITGTRGDTVIRQPDIVGDQSQDSSDTANELMATQLVNLAAKTIDLSRPVDEYQSAAAALTLEVIPEYEMDELIECIVIVSTRSDFKTPTLNTITLQLGNRTWTFSASENGLMVINGMNMRLSRHDRRILTQTVSGALSLELTGHADMRG